MFKSVLFTKNSGGARTAPVHFQGTNLRTVSNFQHTKVQKIGRKEWLSISIDKGKFSRVFFMLDALVHEINGHCDIMASLHMKSTKIQANFSIL